MELRILLLGTVELQSGERRGRLGSGKELMALAALAWDAGRAVSVDTLIHRVWDDAPPAKPREALYPLLSRLRRALADVAGSQAPELTSRAQHYLLAVDPDTVDLRRYLALLDQSHSLADAGSDREALDVLGDARGLWRGEPLSGLPGAWAEELRTLVEMRNASAARMQAAILLRLGRYAEAAGILQPLAQRHRSDESLTGQLALALYGSGRTTEATRLLQRTRQHLLRESGADPGEQLQRIHQGILAQTPPAALLPADIAPVGGMPAPSSPDTLPPDVAWVGRKAELDSLTSVLADADDDSTHAAAVTGMPGCGKTALAVHIAHHLREAFPDGRIFLDLRGHAPMQSPMTPAEALRKLLHLLGIPREEIPQGIHELVSLWRTTVRNRRFVAILDDATGPDQVRPIIPGSSPALIIVTSRQRMTGLPGVRSLPMDVLTRKDAIALIQRMMGTKAPRATDAASLARLCDHLPLAITLIAGRLLARPSWRVSDLLDRFEHSSGRLPEIHDGRVRIADFFDLSYQELTPVQQLVFRRIGLHIGSEFDSYSVAALSGLTLDETDRVLESLLTHHLISEPSPHRYRMHDLLREHARALAQTDGAIDNRHALHRLIEYYVHAADQADRRAFPHRQRIPLLQSPTDLALGDRDPHQWFTVEGPNVLAALAYTRNHGAPHQLALLTHTLAGFLDTEGYLSTAVPLFRLAATHWEDAGDRDALGRALIDLSNVLSHLGNYTEAVEAAQKSLALSQQANDRDLEAEALHQLSICDWYTTRHKEALQKQQRALQLRLAKNDLLQQGRSFNMLGMICLHLERHKESLKYFLRGLSRFRDVGDRRGQFIALNNLAELHKKFGNPESAITSYRQAIKLSQTLGSKGQYVILQINLASTLQARGKPKEAIAIYHETLPVLRSIGDRHSEVIARHGIARALHAMGRSDLALAHYTAAVAIAHDIQAADEECKALRGLGVAENATGHPLQARAHLLSSLAISRAIDARSEEAETLRVLEHMERGYNPRRAT